LFYPITDFPSTPTQSFETYNTGYYLTGADILWFWDQYLQSPADRLNPYAAPLQAKDFSQLAPAFVLTAQADPLRDEAEKYAKKMEQAGVEVTLTRYSGMIHGFMAFPTPRSDEALLEASAWIQMQKRKL
jgi:acetyl esterase